MARLSPLMALPPVIFAGLAAMFVWGMNREDPNALPSAFQGRPAPAVALAVLGDQPVFADADLRDGKVKLVNFWASWCPPCRAEHPTLTELSKVMPVYGVNLKDPEDAALGFLSEHGDPYRAISTDPRGRTAIDWGVTAPPETFIIDGQGKILYRHAGPLVREDYTNRFLPQLEKALAE